MNIITNKEKARAREILGVEENATTEEIKRNYRKLVLKYHPDRNQGSKEAEEKFREINRAYRLLTKEKTPEQSYYERFYGNDTIWP
jgi:molecular chaperone DnaJ